jgi:hypothetical protein
MRRLVAVVGVSIAGAVLTASPASAGGWSGSSLDPLLPPVAGEETTVGFTVRSHGASPVDVHEPVTAEVQALWEANGTVDDWESTGLVALWEGAGVPAGTPGIVVTDASGDAVLFPARPAGGTGHYVADVVFPEAGAYTWEVLQGVYGLWDLGEIGVGSGSAAVATPPAPATRSPLAWRVALPALAAAAAALALADLVRGSSGRRLATGS